LLLMACTTNPLQIKNEKKGTLKARIELELIGEKKFELDDSTAPKPEYTQVFIAHNKERYLTFLNTFTNSIYFYNYTTETYNKRINWPKTGAGGIAHFMAYHIKSFDSIYLFNKRMQEIVLSNDKSEIVHRISLMINLNDKNWNLKYPQYRPQTVIPFIQTSNELLMTGFFFGVLPESIVSNFRVTACLNFKTNQLRFSNTYPEELYGHNYNWYSDMLTLVYPEILPGGSKLVLSFPVSHNLYVTDMNTGVSKKVYGGSNFTGTINALSSSQKDPSVEDVTHHFMRNDSYTAIKYDKFRHVYYRFLLGALPENDINKPYKEKRVSVIVMDENFNYLGENVIGTWENWNWQNSFVTSEGLNIEYNGKDSEEKYIIFKIFTLKKIEQL